MKDNRACENAYKGFRPSVSACDNEFECLECGCAVKDEAHARASGTFSCCLK